MEDEVVKNIRACLMTSKGGLTFNDLCKDYKMLLDENIPFKKLGYPTLNDFLNIVPGIKTRKRGGVYFIEAVPTSKSAHISKLVSQQKTTNTSKKPKELVNTQKSLPNYQSVNTKMVPASTKRVSTLTKKVPPPTRRVPSPMKTVPSSVKKVPSSVKKVPSLTKNVSPSTKKVPSPTKKDSSPTKEVFSTTKKVPCPIKNVIDTSRMIGSKYTATIENPRPIKITFYLNGEKPRYIHPIPTTLQSKRLKERQTNTAVWRDQTFYKSKDDRCYRSNEKIYQNKSYYSYNNYRNRSPESLYRSMKKRKRERSPRTYLSDRYYYY